MTTTNEFRRFDVASDDSDHHYGGSGNNNITRNTKKSIMKEWKTLEKNLPESIYVRVYEQRIDLMRAVIIGAAGTPYHDGLFFFDIAFPSDYPNHPPKVHFISFGLRLNPNLYTSGYVCLSLLNTWTGKKNELWDPSVSTCLQLLISLQGLVLNEKPYFNEPGSDTLGRFLVNGSSRSYSEYVYGLTCKLNLHLLWRPPKNFEAFVKSHFRDRAVVILTAFTEYANGRERIGYYSADTSSSRPRKHRVSRTYKRWMLEVYPLMVDAFEGCGASLDTSLRSLVLLSESKSKKISTIWTKAMAQIKNAFTWKKKNNRKEITRETSA
ncbi:putative ubiquitin-conjugating enzyme E2 39 [Lotus japonicus]|uniref:putative ubiquitin-conjugating enzyme E2 39 n=1 Tax=Lotus japonicus TaxID=34305 RepID=UPI0025837DDC|nr:putative ubiquitin-conjugating enzyme E2 39 [Lotus japonicus]